MFQEQFSQKIQQILENTQNENEKIETKKEVSYILQEIREKTGIIIGKNMDIVEMEEILQRLRSDKKLEKLEQYFHADSVHEPMPVEEGDIFDFLKLKFLQIKNGLQDPKDYLFSLRKIYTLQEDSQDGFMFLLEHIREIFDSLTYEEQNEVDQIYNAFYTDDIEEDIMDLSEELGISLAQATEYIEQRQHNYAKMHYFLFSLWNTYFAKNFSKLPENEQMMIIQIMNDLRDILDPEHEM